MEEGEGGGAVELELTAQGIEAVETALGAQPVTHFEGEHPVV